MRLGTIAVPYPVNADENAFGDWSHLLCIVAGESPLNGEITTPQGRTWLRYGVHKGKVVISQLPDKFAPKEDDLFEGLAMRQGTGILYDSSVEDQYATKFIKPQS